MSSARNFLPTIIMVAQMLLTVFSPPGEENPTFENIKARQNAEAAAKAAEVRADQAQRDAVLLREQARAHQEEADNAAAAAAEEIQRIKTQMEEAERAKKCAEEFAEASAKAAERSAQEVREEREHVQNIREKAEMAKRAADEQRRAAEASMAQAQVLVSMLAEEFRKAKQDKEAAEERLKKGIQPVVTPSPMELAAAKKRIHYKEGYFHFAVAGISGSGKSSLVNAFRGLRNSDPRAAAVGVIETTSHLIRYQDVNPHNPFVWYDVPGAGTLKCQDWQYFNDQCLYVFDCIVLLIDSRFTTTDVAILTNARRFNIPTYIVRSKADQHIKNIMMEMECDSSGDDEEGNAGRRDRWYTAARKQLVDQTKKSVQANLQYANLAGQRVYIVSNTTLLSIVQKKMPKKTIDEADLICDLFNAAFKRRKVTLEDGIVCS